MASRPKCNGRPTPENKGESYAFLPQVVEMAQHDGGITLPTLGSKGLAETGRLLEAGIDGLTDLAERAVATGDVEGAKVAAKAVLARDPGNIKAKTVELRRREKTSHARRPCSTSAARTQPASRRPPRVDASDELKLVRPAHTSCDASCRFRQPAAQAGRRTRSAAVPGSLTDRFAPQGQMLDEAEQRRRVLRPDDAA